MNNKPTFYAFCLFGLLLVAFLIFGPGSTRAKSPQHRPSGVVTKPSEKSENQVAGRSGSQPGNKAKSKPGALKRMANFVKDLFVTNKAEDDDESEEARVVKITPRAANVTEGPISFQAEAFGITPAIRDMPEVKLGAKPKFDPSTAQIQDSENNEIEVDRSVPGAYDHPSKDALAAKSRAAALAAAERKGPNAPLAMPTPTLSFDGNASTDIFTMFGTTSMPPDTVGDVGPNHYVQLTNIGVFRVFDKTGTPLTAIARISTLFAGLPANHRCRLRDNGDPIVNYDPLADRWVFSQFAITDNSNDANPPFYQCIAVSQTSDPTGAYYAYSFQGPNTNFPDYPHYGVWTDGYYLSTHEFNAYGTAYVQGGFWAFNRVKMLAGDPTANFIYFSRSATFGQMPIDIDGYMPPAPGTPAMFFEFDADEFGGTDSLLPYEFVPNFVTPGSSTFTPLAPIPLAAYDPLDPGGRVDMEQPSPALATHNLDAVASRNMFRIAYRNLGTVASPTNSYVTSFTVNVSGVSPTSAATYQAAIRWAELRRTAGIMSVFDEGTHAPDPASGTGPNRWMGAIAQDNTGNLALGFSRSGPGAGGVAEVNNPSIYWAGRSGGIAAAGVMNEGEALVMQSTGIQAITNSRWGDYSNMAVDPTDDCTFWYTQEYRDSANNSSVSPQPFFWRTRVANFKFPGCTAEPKGTLAVTVTSCATGAPINGASVSADPGSFFRTTDVAGTASIIAAPGAFTVTATKGVQSASTPGIVTNGGSTPVAICLGGPIMAPAAPTIAVENCTPASGTVDRAETVNLSLPVTNTFGATTSSLLVGTVQLTGGVVGASPPQNYGAISQGSTVARNFGITVDSAQLFGKPVIVSLQLQDGASDLGTVTYTMPASTTPGSVQNFDYSGAAVAIPDNNATGATATVTVSGVTGVIQDINFQFTGTSATTGSSGLDHARIGNVAVQLISPAGTTITLVSRPGNPTSANGCTLTNFFNTILDDSAAGLLETNCTAGMTGTFRPSNALANFNNEDPNGVWTLRVSDLASTLTGTLRNFRLSVTPFTGCVNSPTAAPATISGRVLSLDGAPVGGTVIRLSGAASRATITDSNGNYQFTGVDSGAFYTVTPELANYNFAPSSRSFSLVGNKTDAVFTAQPDATATANAIDSSEYFVRQHYLDFLGREPEANGLRYWSDRLAACHGDAGCLRATRIDVSAAFFMSQEFADTGSYVYRLYRGALGRQLRYNEFAADRAQVVGGPNLETSKTAFANAFVQRTEFAQKYQDNQTAASFVDALLSTMNDSVSVNLASERDELITRYNSGVSMAESRALVVRNLIDNATFTTKVYNESFVAMEYYGYLRRNWDATGFNFWMNVMNTTGDHRGMVCSFITSTEYQHRFSSVVSHSNAECGQ